MVFSGPMQELRRRLRRDDFSLELEGSPENFRRLVAQANSLPGVRLELRPQNLVVLQIAAELHRAAVLAEVLKLADTVGLTLQAVHSGLHETENAYLQLLQEDLSHGFQRFDLHPPRPADALPGDPPP